jgi:molybdate transport system substrate-binding protein
MTAVLKILSAGAVKRGVTQVCAAFERDTGTKVEVEFTQAPLLRQRVAAGEVMDVLVVTPNAMDEFSAQGKIVPATRALLGRSRVGVVVHKDASAPDVSDTEAFKRALTGASAVVHNSASSGIYVATLLEKLGLKALLGSKIVVAKSGSAVMETVAAQGVSAIGLAQISEVMVMVDKGCAVKLAAPLPDAIQNITTYHAAASASAGSPDSAAALARALTSDAAKKVFAATGID